MQINLKIIQENLDEVILVLDLIIIINLILLLIQKLILSVKEIQVMLRFHSNQKQDKILDHN